MQIVKKYKRYNVNKIMYTVRKFGVGQIVSGFFSPCLTKIVFIRSENTVNAIK